ncbi:hypothetical protein RhiirA4_454676 [Rhizophagus irregularis]|uniref:Uncharacterized protein n=1 Tax=Rhizophagus irregularis TaxID=588596 RepID=A0A2I1G3F7_9GLOM|nr:hypothetical protein RhiirA4_454676 [Rhizophagus irregularis]
MSDFSEGRKRHTLICSHDLPNYHGQSYLQTSGASSSSIDTLANIRKTTIPKQKYKVAGPNSLWHIDGNRYYQLFGTIIKSYSQNECQRTIYSPQYIGIIIVGTPTLIGIGIFFLAMSFKKDFINTFPWIKAAIATLTQTLPNTNNDLAGNMQNIFFSEQNTGIWWENAEKFIPNSCKLLSIILYSDATNVDTLGKSQLHSIYVSIGNIKN